VCEGVVVVVPIMSPELNDEVRVGVNGINAARDNGISGAGVAGFFEVSLGLERKIIVGVGLVRVEAIDVVVS
jgi:hypothetical protein